MSHVLTEFIDETNEQYHGRESVSASMLKLLYDSPRLFEARYVTKTIQSKPSDAMRFGSAVHSAILEPLEFMDRYIVCPDECSDRRTTKYKEWAKTAEGLEILTADEYRRIKEIQFAIVKNKVACHIITSAEIREKSFLFTDFLSGVDCRVRFDALAGSVIVDLKTVSDGSEAAFVKSVTDYKYHLQAVHYIEGFRTLDPSTDWRFVFITLETVAPFRCRVFDLDNDSLNVASIQRADLLDKYRHQMASNDWSEPGEKEVVTLSLPNWYKSKASSL